MHIASLNSQLETLEQYFIEIPRPRAVPTTAGDKRWQCYINPCPHSRKGPQALQVFPRTSQQLVKATLDALHSGTHQQVICRVAGYALSAHQRAQLEKAAQAHPQLTLVKSPALKQAIPTLTRELEALHAGL